LHEFVELIGAVVSDVELAVDGVVEDDSFVDVAKGFVDDVVKEKVEECWGKNTSLANTVVDAERFGDAAIGLYCGSGVVMEILDETLKFAGKA